MNYADTPFSGFAVRDIDEAANFYGKTLGLSVDRLDMGILQIGLGDSKNIIVYPKDDHTPANFTVLNLPVKDVEAAVDELAGQGVTFESYDGFDQDDKGIVRGPVGPNIAWFRDPSGNILSVLETD